jgi:hypothetical protein
LNAIAARIDLPEATLRTPGPSPQYRAEMELKLVSLVNEGFRVADERGRRRNSDAALANDVAMREPFEDAK